MNNILKQAGAILSLSLLCGMQVYAFPDYPSLRGQIIEQSDICQGELSKMPMAKALSAHPYLSKGRQTAALRDLTVIFPLGT